MANRKAGKQNKCVNVKKQKAGKNEMRNKKKGNGQQIKTRQNKNKNKIKIYLLPTGWEKSTNKIKYT